MVSTVDGFQGAEADAIIISFVRCSVAPHARSPDQLPNLGFQLIAASSCRNGLLRFHLVRSAGRNSSVGFLADFRRLNVALTRARRLLVLVGHAATLAAAGGGLGALVRDVQARGVCVASAGLQLH
jgi:hypothetical protein